MCGRRLVSTQPAGGCHWGLSAFFSQGLPAETDAREIFGHETAFLEKSELSVSYFGPNVLRNRGDFAGRWDGRSRCSADVPKRSFFGMAVFEISGDFKAQANSTFDIPR